MTRVEFPLCKSQMKIEFELDKTNHINLRKWALGAHSWASKFVHKFCF